MKAGAPGADGLATDVWATPDWATSDRDAHDRTALEGDWSGLVVFHAANSWDSVRFADQHLAERLSDLTPVLYVDPAISFLTPYKRPELRGALRGPRLQLVKPGLARLVTVSLPGPERPVNSRVTQSIMQRRVARAVASLGTRIGAVLSGPTLTPLLGCWPQAAKVYWAQDDLVGGASLVHQSASRIERAELRLVAASDVLVVSSPVVADDWRRKGYHPVLIPFGWDDRTFTPAAVDEGPWPADVTLKPPIAGFVGHLGDRIDLSLLEAVAGAGHSLLLVGPLHPRFPQERLRPLLARNNVQWVGGKNFEDLPTYLRAIDVGLVPYNDSAFNRGSFPLKTLEYLGSGRAVVATDLPAIRWLDTDLIRVATGAHHFAAAVSEALAVPADRGQRARRRDFAGLHSWERRAQQFADVISTAR
jgi:teichuronic acid biosynthesis glycosyltransferase TuaH